MPLGRIDECTTANVGRIEGGVAVNIVPAVVTLMGSAVRCTRIACSPSAMS
ncbi:MAG: hypothetical protein ACLSDQ_12655 [Adlercreutzia equolifaciens]